MAKVPTLRQRIAGKSIPIEKFVARKARKFAQQGARLALPALEFAYFFLGIAHAPRSVVLSRMLPLVQAQLDTLDEHASEPAKYGSAGVEEYWDDRALALFLKGICLRYVAYPDPDAVLHAADEAAMKEGKAEAEKGSREAFEAVFEVGPKIVYDHYLVYLARKWFRLLAAYQLCSQPRVDYEYARLLACQGDKENARLQLELVQSGLSTFLLGNLFMV